jgi:hypothetical protein
MARRKRREEGGIRGSSKHDLGCANEALEKRRELRDRVSQKSKKRFSEETYH